MIYTLQTELPDNQYSTMMQNIEVMFEKHMPRLEREYAEAANMKREQKNAISAPLYCGQTKSVPIATLPDDAKRIIKRINSRLGIKQKELPGNYNMRPKVEKDAQKVLVYLLMKDEGWYAPRVAKILKRSPKRMIDINKEIMRRRGEEPDLDKLIASVSSLES